MPGIFPQITGPNGPYHVGELLVFSPHALRICPFILFYFEILIHLFPGNALNFESYDKSYPKLPYEFHNLSQAFFN